MELTEAELELIQLNRTHQQAVSAHNSTLAVAVDAVRKFVEAHALMQRARYLRDMRVAGVQTDPPHPWNYSKLHGSEITNMVIRAMPTNPTDAEALAILLQAMRPASVFNP